MTRQRLLFLGLLLSTILLWGGAWLHYKALKDSRNPAAAARIIEADLHRRHEALQLLLDNRPLLNALYERRENNAGFTQWTDVPFALFLYENGELKAWNSGSIPAPAPFPLDTAGSLVASSFGCAVRIARPVASGNGIADRSLVALLPVKWVFPVENEYLKAHYAASPHLPSELEVKQEAVGRDVHPFRSLYGAFWGHVQLPATTVLPPAAPDAAVILLGLAGLAAFAVLVHMAMLLALDKVGRRQSLLVALLVIGGLRALSYAAPLPFGLRELPLFSSELYGLSAALPSLGDLLVNALCLLLITGFAASHGPKSAAGFAPKKRMPALLCFTIGGILLAALILVSFSTVRIVQSLVMDSQISFDVGRFDTVDGYTAVGFAALGILAAGAALALRILGQMAAAFIPNSMLRYALILFLGLAIGFGGFRGVGPDWMVAAVALWILLFVLLLEKPRPLAFSVAAAPRIVTAMVVLALSTGSLLHFFLRTHTYEKDMVAFAERIVGQEDPLLEYTLSNALRSISADAEVTQFLQAPNAARRPTLDNRLEVLYLSRSLAGYTPRLYFFDAAGKPLYNRDTFAQSYFEDRILYAMPKGSSGLFYNPTAASGRYYTARLQIGDTALLGTLYIDLLLRRTVAETVYPELLQPETMRGAVHRRGYPYAVYAGGLPVTQTEDYPFPEAVPAAQKKASPSYRSRLGRTELWYAGAGNRTAIVVGPERRLLDSAALFSYLFAVLVVLACIAIIYRTVLKWGGPKRLPFPVRVPRLSLRQSIHLSMFGIVLVSLLGVGVVTVLLFNIRYREATNARLRSTVQAIGRSLQQSTAWRSANPEKLDSVAQSSRLRFRLAAISEAQKADVTVFGTDGLLLVSSQDEIYNRGLLPRQMRPNAYRALRNGQPVVLQRERVGAFVYQSAYVPLRNEEGSVLGYVNVPFFSSEKELNDQISGILVTLVNLYALLFLLASGLAYLITQGLTRTLAVITARFRQVKLHRNEVLEWPYDDEIGLLVREYNKMVKELEGKVISLARSEREGAWREMARQVAHEIKNPLTPMKLRIQYLQRALNDKRADVLQIAESVSGTLIEQIDNLSRIASEFSDFARLPEAKPELLELGPLLQRAADLHRSEGQVDIAVQLPAQPVIVQADHSHLLRVLTNLLQNAAQAIPENREGRILIRLLKEDERMAVVSITDNGRGISESERIRIFRPYFTTKSSGTGLGLAMTRQMVEGWGGRIWFESKEGEGTTFFVELSLADNKVDSLTA